MESLMRSQLFYATAPRMLVAALVGASLAPRTALAPNVVAFPTAAGVRARRGFVLTPAVGAVLMSSGTIIVALGAQLLRGVKL
jgi:hypothetical protein